MIKELSIQTNKGPIKIIITEDKVHLEEPINSDELIKTTRFDTYTWKQKSITSDQIQASISYEVVFQTKSGEIVVIPDKSIKGEYRLSQGEIDYHKSRFGFLLSFLFANAMLASLGFTKDDETEETLEDGSIRTIQGSRIAIDGTYPILIAIEELANNLAS